MITGTIGQLALDFLADDAFHDLFGSDVRQWGGEQVAAVAEDGDPVCEPVHLVHAVRDVDD